jgi:hypothetical protein
MWFIFCVKGIAFNVKALSFSSQGKREVIADILSNTLN